MSEDLLRFQTRKFLGKDETVEKVIEQFEIECQKYKVTPEQIADTLDWIIYNLADRQSQKRIKIADGIEIMLAEMYEDTRGDICPACLNPHRKELVTVIGNAAYFIIGLSSGDKVKGQNENVTLIGNLLPHYIRAHHFPEGTVDYGLKTEFLAELVKRVKIPTLIGRLKGGELILMDGAIGSNRMEGVPIQKLHQMFYDNGSIVSNTDTFTANPLRMEQDRENPRKCKSMNYRAVMAAKSIRGTNYIRGSIGPQGDFLEPLGNLTKDKIRETYRKQIDTLVRIAGIHCLSIETAYDPEPARVIADLAMEYHLPVIVSFPVRSAFQKDKLVTYFGPFNKMFDQFRDIPILGVNCCLPGDGLKFLQKYRDKTNQFLMVEPNAGQPTVEDNKTVFPLKPEEFGDFALKYKKAGANLIGGCCGTTPEHILHAAKALGIR